MLVVPFPVLVFSTVPCLVRYFTNHDKCNYLLIQFHCGVGKVSSSPLKVPHLTTTTILPKEYTAHPLLQSSRALLRTVLSRVTIIYYGYECTYRY